MNNTIKTKTDMFSIKLSTEHRKLLETTAKINGCSKAKVVEDSFNKYWALNNDIIK
jgi:uncharacterized protein (DUF1778 family)|tara:strand:+ start:945 stop:1112 length:168 start_codon:yes stop_codon:yes gene_type:complete